MYRVKVIKLKRKSDFEQQRYKVLFDGNEINVSCISASVDTENIELTKVTFQLLTYDFEWLNEGAAGLYSDSPTENQKAAVLGLDTIELHQEEIVTTMLYPGQD